MTKKEINSQIKLLKEKVGSKNIPAVIIKQIEKRIADLKAMITV